MSKYRSAVTVDFLILKIPVFLRLEWTDLGQFRSSSPSFRVECLFCCRPLCIYRCCKSFIWCGESLVARWCVRRFFWVGCRSLKPGMFWGFLRDQCCSRSNFGGLRFHFRMFRPLKPVFSGQNHSAPFFWEKLNVWELSLPIWDFVRVQVWHAYVSLDLMKAL